MHKKQQDNEEFIVTLSDFIHLFTKRKKVVLIFVCTFSLLVLTYKLTRPISYTAEALFKEKQNRQGPSVTQSLFEAFTYSGFGQENEAVTLFRSRRVMDDVAQKLHLQGTVVQRGAKFSTLRKIFDNIKTQIAHFRNQTTPLFPESDCTIACEDIVFDGEIPTTLTIQFRNDEAFSIKTTSGQPLGTGVIGEPFVTDHYRFTVRKNKAEGIRGKIFDLSLIPLNTISHNLSKLLKVEPDKKSKHILEIKITHTNRKLASEIVNGVMGSYQQYISDEHKRFTTKHLDYLRKRKEDSFRELSQIMNDYAQNLSQDVNASGYLDTDSEMRYLVENHIDSLKKLQLMKLEAKRLETYIQEDRIPLVNISETPSNSATQTIDKLRDLKQHRDNLSLVLYEKKKTEDKNSPEYANHLQEEYNALQSSITQIKDITHRLELQLPINEKMEILRNPKLLVGSWYRQYKENTVQKKAFISYLNTLERTFSVYSDIIQERLARDCPGNIEFQGIDLETANQLFLHHNKTCNELESEERQNMFVIDQLQDPNFEIASLSTTLQDPICIEMIAKASNLAFMLRDDSNRSPKEQERIRKELITQKAFLQSHLEQTTQILKIRQEMLQEKITSLQEVMLEHINEKISILETNLKDYVTTKIKILQQEKDLINSHLASLNLQMSQVPKKWVSENIVKQNISLTKASVEEITRMVEGKNISQNLDVVQSTPVDYAIVSILPNHPKLLLFTVLGALLGGFLSVGYLILESILCGIEATENNLKASNQTVSGYIRNENQSKSLLDENLETLRRALFNLGPQADEILLIKGKGADLSKALASLLSKQGEKVIVLPVTFRNKQDEESGLLQFLEGKTDSPSILHEIGYDYITAGGFSRYSVEQVSGKRFKELRKKLKETYTKIIAVADCSPCSAEAEGYLALYQNIIVTLSGEKLLHLTSFTKASGKNVTFVFSK